MKTSHDHAMTSRYVARLIAWIGVGSAIAAIAAPAFADPDIWSYAVPPSLSRLSATARTKSADQEQLEVIGKDFGEAYRLKEGRYTFTAPDRMEYMAAVGPTKVTYISTNTQLIVHAQFGPVHKDFITDISGDMTKRKTLFDLGILPKNYLETMRVQYDGEDMAIDIPCQVFTLRFKTDPPDCSRRFKVWIDPVKHYVVQKTVWNLQNIQHETIIYRYPEIVPGTSVYLPTWAEVWNQKGKLGGVIQYVKVSGEQTG